MTLLRMGDDSETTFCDDSRVDDFCADFKIGWSLMSYNMKVSNEFIFPSIKITYVGM